MACSKPEYCVYVVSVPTIFLMEVHDWPQLIGRGAGLTRLKGVAARRLLEREITQLVLSISVSADLSKKGMRAVGCHLAMLGVIFNVVVKLAEESSALGAMDFSSRVHLVGPDECLACKAAGTLIYHANDGTPGADVTSYFDCCCPTEEEEEEGEMELFVPKGAPAEDRQFYKNAVKHAARLQVEVPEPVPVPVLSPSQRAGLAAAKRWGEAVAAPVSKAARTQQQEEEQMACHDL